MRVSSVFADSGLGTTGSAAAPTSVSVGVVAICGPERLDLCLAALRDQKEAPPFDVVVVYDPALRGIEEIAAEYGARAVSNAGQRTPLELASRAISETTGDLVLLTEDHCIPAPDWVRTMCDAQGPGRAVVGGRVEIRPDAGPVDWAFYFVDFFRYAAPVERGPSPSLTVCNAAYSRAHLEAIRGTWSTIFHETAVNEALREHFGDLWLEPESEVAMRRHVTFREAVRERYAFGRLFGCTRLDFCSRAKRLFYVATATLLPFLLLGRMAHKGLGAAALRGPFLHAAPALVALVLAWSLGEWLGYLTRRRPGSLVAAQERAPSA